MTSLQETRLTSTTLEQTTLEHPASARPKQTHAWRLSTWRRLRDFLTRITFGVITALTCSVLLALIVMLTWRSLPILSTFSLTTLLTGERWLPTQQLFGLAPFLIGSVAVTLLAMVLAVPPAILSGIYLAEFTTMRTRNILKPVLDLLVGIPSVVYGLWGVLFIVPLIRDHIAPWSDRTLGQWIPFFARTNPSGYSLLAAGMVLAIMVFPFIVAITDEVLRTIPGAMRESLLALGATRWETTKTIVRRAAAGGIGAAVILGFSRAFGETLAVMMVIGNTPQLPRSLFDAAYSLPALIANNYGEMMSVPLYESALMMASLVLLVIIVAFNIGAALVVNRLVGGNNRRYSRAQ
jgi:phosphate transport system permease protein